MRAKLLRVSVICFVIGALLLSACGPTPTPEPTKAPPTPTAPPAAEATPTEAVAAGEEAVSTGTMTLCKTNDPNSIDPHVHDGWYSVRVQHAAYETLVNMMWNEEKQANEFQPLLATDWELSDDGMTYTFHLQEGVEFTDGCPFNSEAVKVTFERNQALGLRAFHQVEPIREIETPDDYTVILHLKYPYTPFMLSMHRAYIMSPCAIEEHKTDEDPWAEAFFNENMVGTGPYMLKQFVRESIVELVQNPDYWQGWAGKHFERIVLKHVPERATHALLIEKGDCDIADHPPYDDMERLDALPDVEVHNYSYPVFPFMWELRARGPLEDIRVRKALLYAIDYDAIIEEVMNGTATRLYGPIGEGLEGYCEEYNGLEMIKWEYDMDKAKALLEEAGYADGFDLTFTMPTVLPFEKDVAVALQAMWAPLNINLKIDEMASSATYMSASYTWEEPKIYDAFGMILSAYIPDPHWYVGHPYGEEFIPGFNASYYVNDRVEELLAEGKQTPFGPERNALYCEASLIINNDAVHIWQFTKNDVKAFRSDIKGYVFNPSDAAREYYFYDMYRED